MPADLTTEIDPRKKKHVLRRLLIGLGILIVIALVAGELFARFYLGLGDPPLTCADSQTKYISLPDQTCHRFGHLIHYNHYSMRSDDFPEHKSKPDELRVMVIGDSIINGGAQTDQSEIATQLLQSKLSSDLKRPVIVGNISAGGWGPPNELGYLKKYGLFDADVLVIVLNSADYGEAPPPGPWRGNDLSFPSHKPPLALWDGFHRYLMPRLGLGTASNEGSPAAAATPSKEAIDECRAAVGEMISLGRKNGVEVIVAQYLVAAESPGATLPGFAVLGAEARRDGVEPVDLGKAFAEGKQHGEQLYRDPIHPNPDGQRVLCATLLPVIETARRDSITTAPASGPASAVAP